MRLKFVSLSTLFQLTRFSLCGLIDTAAKHTIETCMRQVTEGLVSCCCIPHRQPWILISGPRNLWFSALTRKLTAHSFVEIHLSASRLMKALTAGTALSCSKHNL